MHGLDFISKFSDIFWKVFVQHDVVFRDLTFQFAQTLVLVLNVVYFTTCLGKFRWYISLSRTPQNPFVRNLATFVTVSFPFGITSFLLFSTPTTIFGWICRLIGYGLFLLFFLHHYCISYTYIAYCCCHVLCFNGLFNVFVIFGRFNCCRMSSLQFQM